MKLPPIFLSASIPIAGREFDDDIETERIRDAVLALVTVCRDRKLSLVFGGHPAISPLVHHAAESLGVVDNVTIYQSEFYRKIIPEAAQEFPNLEWTDPGEDASTSQAIMRDVMINRDNWKYTHAVFIGGMNGILDEAERFHRAYPGRPLIPLQYTGGASRKLQEQLTQILVEEERKPVWLIPDGEQSATSVLRYRRLLDRSLSIS